MIEDKASTLLDIKEHIPVICFDAPYNRNIDTKNLFRVRNWKEVKKKYLKTSKKENEIWKRIIFTWQEI